MDEDEIISNPFEDGDFDGSNTIYRTYRMDFKNKRIIGIADGIEASSQAMFKALQTRRYAHVIYDDQYGSDIYNKIGVLNLTKEYLEADLPVMVEDAFANDDSIINVDNLSFEMVDVDAVHITFEVETIFGEWNFEGVIYDG